MPIKVPDDLIQVGHVSGAYGIHGWVRIKPYSAEAQALLRVKTWWLDKPSFGDVDMLEARMQGDDVVARLMGVPDRNAAEDLKGAAVQIRRSSFPPLEEDEFYWVDLIGLSVENIDGQVLGVVANLMESGAHPILRVQPPTSADGQTSAEILIPFVERHVPEVDLKGKRIIVDWTLDY